MSGKLVQCLADDFEFPLHCGVDNLGVSIGLQIQANDKSPDRIGGSLSVPKDTFERHAA